MAQAKNKTAPSPLKVSDYMAAIEKDDRRADCQALLDMMADITGWEPVIWGTTLKSGIVGFGTYHYVYSISSVCRILIPMFCARSWKKAWQ